MADNPVIVDPTEDGTNWDRHVAQSEASTFFHSAAWARVLHDTYGHRPLYLAASNPSSSSLPVMEINSWITGRRGVSLPFTDECLPLASNSDQARDLIMRAIQIGRERRWRYFASQGSGSLFPYLASGSPSYYGHSLDLQKSVSELFGKFSEANRRAIRKAEKAGIALEMSTDLQSLAVYYLLHCQTRKRFGVPPQPWELFRQIHRHVLDKQLGFVQLARQRGRPIAGAVFCHSGHHAVFKFGASDPANQALRPNNLILWEAIRWFAEKGFATLSLGRTSTTNEGLRRFKLGWGSTEHKVWYLKYDYQSGRFMQNADNAYGWYNYIFRHLPVWASRLAGTCLYRHWA